MQQQQQQFADFDLLAVYSDEMKAEAAEAKLHKEGFGENEVFRLASSAVRSGEFRDGKYDTGFVERMMSSEKFQLVPPPAKLHE